MSLDDRLKEAALGHVLSHETRYRSPYAIVGHPPMWDLLDLPDGRTMAIRPARTQVRSGHAWQEVQGVGVGWHRAGEWTADQHLSMSWQDFTDRYFIPALVDGARISPATGGVLNDLMACDELLHVPAEDPHDAACPAL